MKAISLLLALLMLLACTACTQTPPSPEGTTAETTPLAPPSEESTPPSVEETTEPPVEEITEEETLPVAADYEITEQDGTATILTPMGLSYTLTGYASLDKAAATPRERLTYRFPEETFSEKFNRFTLTYAATAPVRIKLTYTERGRPLEDVFFLDAKEGCFSGLSFSFLTGNAARNISSLEVLPLTDATTSFTLVGLSTEILEELPRTYYLENDRFKLGIDLGWGGTVSYLEDKNCSVPRLTNLVNRYDTGRLIQQSFYGVQENDEYTPGVSFGHQWRYNPVQGGDQFNNPSRLIDVVITETSLYVKSQPQDWSLDNALTPSYYENTYTLDGDCVKVDNRFTDYSGWEHPFSSQELPAFYTVSYLDTFVWYNGDRSWQGDTLSSRNDLPFWGDYPGICTFTLKEKNTETWCAWINGQDNYGLGIFVPNIDQHKAGRYLFDGSKRDSASSTGYVAPINILQIVSFDPIEYSYLLTAGSVESIRQIFTERRDFTDNADLHVHYRSSRLPSLEGDITKLDFTEGKDLSALTSPVDTTVTFDEAMGAAKLTAGSFGDVSVSFPYSLADTPLSAESYKTLKIEYCIPTEAAKSFYQSDIFLCAGDITAPDGNARLRVDLIKDGEFHILEVDLSQSTYWTGVIHKLRFDYFDSSAAGDVMYIKRVTLE